MSDPSGGRTHRDSRASVLGEIEKIAGSSLKIRLRGDAVGSETPLVLEDVDLELKDVGRYELLGELARGGVGVILICRDVDLGREVAVKVLRGELAENEDILKRFVEEAQVGGQLQHPGIVSIYELGLREDGRPYFTMKLVRGRTLSALLADRPTPTESIRKYLTIFEEIAHAIAFAHSRGVIHRDLKPANVLVGDFGEVQVVDWGFAKVLSSGGIHDERRAIREQGSVIETVRSRDAGSESMAGSVLGTPAYMPPEQARGQVDRVDRRSDVFALGAILAEILTGAPAYVGESNAELLVMASRARLDDVLHRLASDDVDEKLAGLARRCLSPEPKHRPKDAHEVAGTVADWLSSVDRRRHQARVLAEKAKVKAAAERRARMLTTVLAVVLGLLAVGGLSTFFLMAKRKADRRAERDGRIVASTEEATRLADLARESADLPKWAEAVEAARTAVELSRGEGVPVELAERARSLGAAIESQHHAARSEAENGARNRELLERLAEIRDGSRGDLSPGEADAAYTEAFLRAGMDVGALGPAEIASRIRESGLGGEIATAFDAWAILRRSAWPEAPALWSRLFEVATAVDGNPWRNDLRAAWLSGNEDRIRELARTADPARLDPQSVSLVGNALGQFGDAAGAAALLGAGHRAHPSHFGLCSSFAYWLSRSGDREEAIRYYTAALALRPESAASWNNLALVLGELGDSAEEERALRKAVELDPGFARARYNLAIVLKESGRMEEALDSLRAVVRSRPDYALAREVLGTWLARRGKTGEAEAHFRGVIGEGGSPEAYRQLAKIQRSRDDWTSAIETLSRGLAVSPDQASLHFDMGLSLEGDENTAAALGAFEAAVRVDEDLLQAHQAIVRVLEKEGRIEESVARWQEDADADEGDWVSRFRLGIYYLESRGESVRASTYLKEVVALKPDSARAWNWLGFSLQAKDFDLPGSVDAYRRAVELDPDDPVHHNDLGATLQAMGEVVLATREYRKAAELDPDNVIGHVNLGRIYRAGRRVHEAIDAYREAVRTDPRNPVCILEFVGVLLSRARPEDVEEAITVLRDELRQGTVNLNIHHAFGRAISFRDDLSVARETYGRLLPGARPQSEISFLNGYGLGRNAQGDIEEALLCHRAARELDPGNEAHLYNIAFCLKWLGRIDESIEVGREAVRSNPHSRSAMDHLADLLVAKGDLALAILVWRDVLREIEKGLRKSGEVLGWHPLQATGAPDADRSRDDPRTWASLEPDAGTEWIELGFEPAVKATHIRIWEADVRGAIVNVVVVSELGARRSIWSGDYPAPLPDVLEIPLSADVPALVGVKIILDTSRSPGFSAIDAVELVGEAGSAYAVTAEASSTYAFVNRKKAQSHLANVLLARSRSEDLQEVLGLTRRWLAAEPEEPSSYADVGLAYGRLGNRNAALDFFATECATATPSSRAAFFRGLGNGLRIEGHVQDAVGCYQQSYALDPIAVNTHYCLGLALGLLDNLDEGLESWNRIADDPDPSQRQAVLRGLAESLSGRWLLEDACRARERVMELREGDEPEERMADTVALARQMSRMGRREEARRLIEKAAMDGFHPALYTTLSSVRRHCGDAHGARHALLAILERDRQFQPAWLGLGVLRLENGDFPTALQYFRRGSAGSVRQSTIQELTALATRLGDLIPNASGILSGNARPPDTATALDYARFCFFRNSNRVAVRYFEEAFAADPDAAENLDAGHRHFAARAALRAGRFGRALRWLEADLAAWRRRAEEGVPGFYRMADEGWWRLHPRAWLGGPDLGPLSTPEGRADLPEEWPDRFEALFSELREFLLEAGRPVLR